MVGVWLAHAEIQFEYSLAWQEFDQQVAMHFVTSMAREPLFLNTC
jgi:hypothetical protein